MTGEEVCAMMDAIYAGRKCALEWEGANLSDSLEIDVRSRVFRIGLDKAAKVFDIEDPRIAREIAAALVTWASTKDGIIFDQLGAASKVKAMQERQGSEIPRL